MNNLFFDLPENLQDKITRMNPHPVAEMFNDAIENEYDKCNSNYLRTKKGKLWVKTLQCLNNYHTISKDVWHGKISWSFDLNYIKYNDDSE